MRDLTLKCWAHAVLLVVLLLISLRPALAQEALRLATLEPSVNREALEAEKAAGRHKLGVLLDRPGKESIQLIRVDPEVVRKSTNRLSVLLPGGRAVEFKLRNYKGHESDEVGSRAEAALKYTPADYWFGDASSDVKDGHFNAANFIFLARRGDSLRGRVVVEGKLYVLEDVGNGQHGLMQVDMAAAPPCLVLENEPAVQEHATKAVASKSISKAKPSISVLLVSTRKTNTMEPSAMIVLRDELEWFNEMTNQGDGVSLKLTVAHMTASNAADSIFHHNDKILLDFTDAETEATKEVARLRKQHAADVVIVGAYWVDKKEVTYDEAQKDNAFYVFNIKSPEYFLHGFGHLMGINHVWKPGGSEYVPPYQFGFISPTYEGKRYASIGYDPKECTGNCEYIYRWSDPGVTYLGVRFGDDHSHEKRRLNERAVVISNFY
ncbi:hypothetical protein [Pseudomonas sp. BJa3]|uniref:hypothetical protein n=1 Tax=Pseudomonas sp. BJa3 TaxID=2986525 RepID=UPI002265BD62|nr:hypothetical protein [Pseudomonas sp. BJa3]MCX5509508.1 hypothetical protein [Pseudomonas sp. BJa3]